MHITDLQENGAGEKRRRLQDGSEIAPSDYLPLFGIQSHNMNRHIRNNDSYSTFEERKVLWTKFMKKWSLLWIVYLAIFCSSLIILDYLVTHSRGYFLFDVKSAKIFIQSDKDYDSQATLLFSAKSESFLHSVTVHDGSACSVFYDNERMTTLTFNALKSSHRVFFGSQLHESPKVPQEINVHLTRTNFVLARTYFHDSSMHGEIAVECNFRGTINIFGVLPVDSTLVWNSRERRGKIESLTYDLTVFSDLGPWRVYDEDRSRYDVGYGSKSKKDGKGLSSLVAGVIGFGRNRSQSKSWDARTALSATFLQH